MALIYKALWELPASVGRKDRGALGNSRIVCVFRGAPALPTTASTDMLLREQGHRLFPSCLVGVHYQIPELVCRPS